MKHKEKTPGKETSVREIQRELDERLTAQRWEQANEAYGHARTLLHRSKMAGLYGILFGTLGLCATVVSAFLLASSK